MARAGKERRMSGVCVCVCGRGKGRGWGEGGEAVLGKASVEEVSVSS